MSERAALLFIQQLDTDLALQSRLREIRPPGDLQAVVAAGVAAGFDFDVADLRAAFLTDWRLRRRFYAAVTDTS